MLGLGAVVPATRVRSNQKMRHREDFEVLTLFCDDSVSSCRTWLIQIQALDSTTIFNDVELLIVLLRRRLAHLHVKVVGRVALRWVYFLGHASRLTVLSVLVGASRL